MAPERAGRAGRPVALRRRAPGRPRCGAPRADAPPAPDRRRRRHGRRAFAAPARARTAPGLQRRPSVALGRLRRRRAGVDRRRLPLGRAQPIWRAGAPGGRYAPHGRRRPCRRRGGGRAPAHGAGRGASPAPAVARGAGQAGADARRAHRHGAAGTRDRGQDRGGGRRPQPRSGSAGRGAHPVVRDRHSRCRRSPATRASTPIWRQRRPRRPTCARASARAAPS